MTIATILSLGETALKLGLICSLTVLALFLSYSMLNVCDLSTDGCFTLGAAVGAAVAVSGHPFLSIFAAMAAGICSGFVTAILQTKLGVDSLLAGIIVNTALYSVNIAVMGGSSLINMNRTETVFSMMKETLKSTPLKGRGDIVVAFIAVAIVIVFLVFFLRTRLGLAIRATGNNADMVKSSSINPVFTTIVGLCVANSFTALSGCLLSQSQKSVDINIGQGMVTIALASLLIGGTILGRGGIFVRAVGMVLGSFIFRLVYTVALRFNMPAFMLKLVSSVIVVLAISGPYLKKQWPQIKRRMTHRKGVTLQRRRRRRPAAHRAGRHPASRQHRFGRPRHEDHGPVAAGAGGAGALPASGGRRAGGGRGRCARGRRPGRYAGRRGGRLRWSSRRDWTGRGRRR